MLAFEGKRGELHAAIENKRHNEAVDRNDFAQNEVHDIAHRNPTGDDGRSGNRRAAGPNPPGSPGGCEADTKANPFPGGCEGDRSVRRPLKATIRMVSIFTHWEHIGRKTKKKIMKMDAKKLRHNIKEKCRKSYFFFSQKTRPLFTGSIVHGKRIHQYPRCSLKSKSISDFQKKKKIQNSQKKIQKSLNQKEDFLPFVPTTSFDLYKGQSGKVGVIGGCLEYTGAPFFAGITVLRLGGDLSHIFCAKSAAIPIKSYSPDLIVHPYLPDVDEDDFVRTALENVLKWLPSVQSFVIGPGLGRNRATLAFAAQFLERIKSESHPVVIDGDALFLVAQNPSLVQGVTKFILTPNGGEFIRLQTALNLSRNSTPQEMARALGGVTVFAKGRADVVTDGTRVEQFEFNGSPRRVGGQGDILAGAIGLFVGWARNEFFKAAGAASEIVKTATVAAYRRIGRGTITSDIINELAGAIPESWRSNEIAESKK
jgi:ATP-dependent NAD(P)H-hydrate dehydratase